MSKEKLRNKQRPIASRIRQGVENLSSIRQGEKPGSWPVSPILRSDNLAELIRYKDELARQCRKYWTPENVRVGIDALRKAREVGIDIGPVNETLGSKPIS